MSNLCIAQIYNRCLGSMQHNSSHMESPTSGAPPKSREAPQFFVALSLFGIAARVAEGQSKHVSTRQHREKLVSETCP